MNEKEQLTKIGEAVDGLAGIRKVANQYLGVNKTEDKAIAKAIENLAEDKERLLYANGVLDDLATDRKTQIDALTAKLNDERIAYDQLRESTDKTIEIQKEQIDGLEDKLSSVNWTSGNIDGDYKLVNEFDLGKWKISIKSKQ